MNNVLVCVTQQQTCDRLITYGRKLADENGGDLMIIHIASYEFKYLAGSDDGEALEYLYQKSLEYGANLTVIRSNNVLATLASQVEKNDIGKVVMGVHREGDNGSDMTRELKAMIGGDVELITVPEEETDDVQQAEQEA